MNGSKQQEQKIDDESIARPPYPGPDDEALPDNELSEKYIVSIIARLFSESNVSA